MVNGHPNAAMTRKGRQLSAQGEGGVQLVCRGITAVPQPSLWLLIKIPLSSLSGNGHSSRIKRILSRNFRELHAYLYSHSI